MIFLQNHALFVVPNEIEMSTLSASPASSPPEYSVIISKGDLPPPYPGDEEPPPYSSVVLEAANTVACDEDENRSRYCNGSRCSWSCPQCPSRIRPVWRKPVAPCLVSYFDIVRFHLFLFTFL